MDRLDNDSLKASIKILHSYLRMSTLEQRLGRSEARQVNKMREWTLSIPAVFDETYRDFIGAFHGSHRSHGALGRFLDAVRSGELSPKCRALGIESFDRLTREHSWDADTLIHQIIDGGITVVIESLGFLVLTRERMLQEPQLQHLIVAETTRARAESERKQGMSLDNRAAERREARTMKRPVTSRAPPWLSLPRQEGTRAERALLRASRVWVIIKERKKVVVLIFEMAADGFSAADIANHLNATGTPTFTGTPEWRRNQVQWILANKAVLGVYVPGQYVEDRNRKRGRRRVKGTQGEVEGYYPAIISEDLWKRARKVINSHKQSGRGRKGAALTNLVSGLVYCEICGAKAHYSNGYLRCSMSLQRACENTTGFPYAALEANLMKLGDFTEFVANQFAQPPRPDTTQERVANLEAEIARKTAALVQMIRDYVGKSGPQAEAAMAVQDELNEDIKRLERGLAEAREQVGRDAKEERKGFLARFWAAKKLIESDDPKESRNGRVRLATEFNRLIQGIVLHPAEYRSPTRVVSVHLKPDVDGYKIVYAFIPQTLVGLRVMAPNGTTAFLPPSVLSRIRSSIEHPENADDLTLSELRKRSLRGTINIRMVKKGKGNFQGVLLDEKGKPIPADGGVFEL
jgi:DNA invertase Pin-like site-specific DNA recombinase